MLLLQISVASHMSTSITAISARHRRHGIYPSCASHAIASPSLLPTISVTVSTPRIISLPEEAAACHCCRVWALFHTSQSNSFHHHTSLVWIPALPRISAWACRSGEVWRAVAICMSDANADAGDFLGLVPCFPSHVHGIVDVGVNAGMKMIR